MTARYYDEDRLGPVCRTCLERVPLALGVDVHPTCDPASRALLARLAGVLVEAALVLALGGLGAALFYGAFLA